MVKYTENKLGFQSIKPKNGKGGVRIVFQITLEMALLFYKFKP